MKIFQVHNYYQQAGGEDAVVAAERVLLEEHGHQVVPFYKHNEAVGSGFLALVKISLQTLWNHQIYREFRTLLQKERPDVVHCHNTFPLISPSIYWACAKEGVPVVQTLHNYRLLCLNAFLFRQSGQSLMIETPSAKNSGPPGGSSSEAVVKKSDFGPSGSICELCLRKRFKFPGIRYCCYRESRAASAVVALMLFVHKLIGTYSNKVSLYIALTEFQKQKMIEGGLPEQKIWVKPNFIAKDDEVKELVLGVKPDLNLNHLKPETGAPYALFVGRLSPEKGCDVLVRAWAEFQADLTPNAQSPAPSLLIVGDGPEREVLEKLADSCQLTAPCEFMGKQPKDRVLSLMRDAQCLVLPSLWYEGFPMTIVEAFSQGCPVVASNVGSMTSVIHRERNGLLFGAGDSGDLAEKMAWMLSHSAECEEMGRAARKDFEEKYSAEVNVQRLMEIYREVAK